MAIFFTVLLVVSIVGMMTLLVLKRYELNTGRVFLAASRPAIGAFFHRKLQWIEYVLPGLMRLIARNLYRAARRLLHVAAAWIVVRVERGLESTLRYLRHSTTVAPKRGEETSAFLREVAEHKKKLQDELPDRSTIVEE